MTHLRAPTTVQLHDFLDGWSALPSKAPFPDDYPSLTTGHAIYLIRRSTRELEAYEAAMREIVRLATSSGAGPHTLRSIHAVALTSLQGGPRQ